MSDQTKKAPEWSPVWPPPWPLPRPPGRHMHRAEPEKVFEYRDEANRVLGYVGKFKRKEHAGYELIPLTFCQHGSSGDRAWRWISFPVPRPIYGLNHRQDDGPILICTSEEQADRARRDLGGVFWCISWPGADKGFKKVDWAPIAQRDVYILPDDTDLPAALAQFLLSIAGTVQVAQPKKDFPRGWTPADAIGADWSLSELTTFAFDREQVAQTSAGLPDKMAGSDDWRIGLLYADSGKLIDCTQNVIFILQRHPIWKGCLGLDEFANRVMIRRTPEGLDAFKPGEWQQTHDVELSLWLAQQEDRMIKVIVKSDLTIGAAATYVAGVNRFHPVRDYLNSLEWDQRGRIDDWFSDFLGVKQTEYAKLAGRFFLLGMVARAFEPGCQMRLVPVLEGEQWRGKSTALRTLVPRVEWFSDTPFNVGDKDAYQSLLGKWLYEIAEFDSFSRAEASRVKAFVSSVRDNFRAPYERRNRDWPRQLVFGATVNQDEYFKDPSGNTRFAPIRCGEINIAALERERDQLFAEATHRYLAGERQYPTRDELEKHFRPEQDFREISDPWAEIIYRFIDGKRKVTIEEILVDCLKIEPGKMDSAKSMATRVGIQLKKFGWVKRQREGYRGPARYYYTPPEVKVPVVVEGPAGKSGGGDENDDVPF